MAFSNISFDVKRRIFFWVNLLVIGLWLLILTDYMLPRTGSEATVQNIERKTLEVTGKHHSGFYIDYVLHTTGPDIKTKGLVENDRIKEGDTVMIRRSLLFHAPYELGVRDRTRPCCMYYVYEDEFKNDRYLPAVPLIGILLILIASIPRLPDFHRTPLATFSYILLIASVWLYFVSTFGY